MSPGAAKGAEVTPERASAKMKLTQKAHVHVGPVSSPRPPERNAQTRNARARHRWTVRGLRSLWVRVSRPLTWSHKDKQGGGVELVRRGRKERLLDALPAASTPECSWWFPATRRCEPSQSEPQCTPCSSPPSPAGSSAHRRRIKCSVI